MSTYNKQLAPSEPAASSSTGTSSQQGPSSSPVRVYLSMTSDLSKPFEVVHTDDDFDDKLKFKRSIVTNRDSTKSACLLPTTGLWRECLSTQFPDPQNLECLRVKENGRPYKPLTKDSKPARPVQKVIGTLLRNTIRISQNDKGIYEWTYGISKDSLDVREQDGQWEPERYFRLSSQPPTSIGTAAQISNEWQGAMGGFISPASLVSSAATTHQVAEGPTSTWIDYELQISNDGEHFRTWLDDNKVWVSAYRGSRNERIHVPGIAMWKQAMASLDISDAQRISIHGVPIPSRLDSQDPLDTISVARRLTRDIPCLEPELSDKKSTLTWKFTLNPHILTPSSSSQQEIADPVWFRLTGIATSDRPASDMLPSDDSLIWEEWLKMPCGTDQYIQ